jgi:hypothetical protein
MFNKNTFWNKNKQRDLMRWIIPVFVIVCILTLSSCSANYDEANEENELLRLEVDDALQAGRYASVITLLDILPDFPESQSIREQAEEGVYRTGIINDITDALSRESFKEVLSILDRNPQFEDVTGFRQTAILEIEKRDAEEQLSQQEDLTMLSELITEMFQIVSLEIYTRNQRLLEVVPRGFLNPGTITVVLEFDSVVKFGVANPETIIIRRNDHILYVDASSIQIEVLDSIIRNTEQVNSFYSNPIIRYTQAVIAQILEEITALEKAMAEQMGTELNLGVAKRSFMTSFEAFCLGMGLSVVWENA